MGTVNSCPLRQFLILRFYIHLGFTCGRCRSKSFKKILKAFPNSTRLEAWRLESREVRAETRPAEKETACSRLTSRKSTKSSYSGSQYIQNSNISDRQELNQIKELRHDVGCEFLTELNRNNTIFCDVTPYSFLYIHWRFGRTYWLRFEGAGMSYTSYQKETFSEEHYLLSLLFLPEDGGSNSSNVVPFIGSASHGK